MSITIKFQNEFGHEITEQQINNGLEYYSKVFTKMVSLRLRKPIIMEF
jgi:hypothetical protein